MSVTELSSQNLAYPQWYVNICYTRKQMFVRKASLEICIHTICIHKRHDPQAWRRAGNKGIHWLGWWNSGLSPSPSSLPLPQAFPFIGKSLLPSLLVFFSVCSKIKITFQVIFSSTRLKWHILGMEMYFSSGKETGRLKLLPRLSFDSGCNTVLRNQR